MTGPDFISAGMSATAAAVSAPAPILCPSKACFFPHSITGLIGGYQAGYLWQFPNHVVLGIEADASFTSPLDAPALRPAPFNTTLDYVGTVRGRVGYAFGTLMPYVTGGFAWGHSHVDINDAAGEIVAIARAKPDPAGPRAPASNLPSAATGAPSSNMTTSICRAGHSI